MNKKSNEYKPPPVDPPEPDDFPLAPFRALICWFSCASLYCSLSSEGDFWPGFLRVLASIKATQIQTEPVGKTI